MNIRNVFFLFLLILLTGCSKDLDDILINIDDIAIYNVVFDANWTEQLQATNYPNNLHFSWMVGITYNQNGLLFSVNSFVGKLMLTRKL